jgi:cytochrome c-type biogenesis protein CcmE
MKLNKFAALTLLALTSIAFAAETVKLADLIKDADKYDGKSVKADGSVKNFKPKKSKAGNDYFTFDLIEGTKKVSVYSHGKLEKDLADGTKVTVEGKYLKEKVINKGKENEFSVKNEIDISGKRGEAPQLKIRTK